APCRGSGPRWAGSSYAWASKARASPHYPPCPKTGAPQALRCGTAHPDRAPNHVHSQTWENLTVVQGRDALPMFSRETLLRLRGTRAGLAHDDFFGKVQIGLGPLGLDIVMEDGLAEAGSLGKPHG